jgi:hypothetical protein
MKNTLAENMLRFGTKNLSEKLKQQLREQAVEQSADATNNPQAVPVTGIAATVGFAKAGPAVKSCNIIARTNVNNKLTTVEEQTKLVQQLESNQLYEQLLRAFSQARSGLSDNVKIWFSQLTQESRLAFLQQFTAWWNEASRKIKKGKRLIEAKLMKAGSRKEKQEVEVVPGQPAPEPISVGLEMAGSNVYADNKSEVTPVLQAKINELVEQAKQAVQIASTTNASVICNKITVASSCSRLRNTNEAANMTWADLSKARANNVTEAIKVGLKSVGVIVPNSISVELRGGYNGDGTSGPNPPAPNSLTTDGKTIVTDEKLRTAKGNPHSNIDDYSPYKFCIANCTLETTWKEVDTDIPNPYVFKKFKNFEMEISEIRPIKGNPSTMNFKTITWNSPQNKDKVFGKLTSCPIF